MTAYTDFHYSPTGSGVISGAQVLEQTEQGINGLGQYVQDNVSGAIDTANEALTTARNADSNATAAINLANSFNAQIIAANQTAGNALTTAQSAQNTANNAYSLATTANNNAATALNAANSASAGVTALTGTVNSLGNRMTAAENAINTNAGNITTLQNNLATTNANVMAATNAASAAQATATSAQSTATLARNQAYVLRYTGTTITGGGTIAYADIDNTDNIKAGDKIIDISGAIYAIASVDTANQTVTVGASPVINLFCDAENLIPAANDAYDLGSSSYQWNNLYAKNYYYNGVAWGLDKANVWSNINTYQREICISGDRNAHIAPMWEGAGSGIAFLSMDATKQFVFGQRTTDANNRSCYDATKGFLIIRAGETGGDTTVSVIPFGGDTKLGDSTNKWKTLNGINPGALSLPKTESDRYSLTELSSISGIGVDNWVLDGGKIVIAAEYVITGWLYVCIACGTDGYVILQTGSYSYPNCFYKVTGTPIAGYASATIPIVEGIALALYLKGTSLIHARYYPAAGNV